MNNVLSSVNAHNEEGLLKTDLRVEEFSLIADEPLIYGGSNLGPSPADYLCMALASCQAITLRLYAKRKGWPLEGIDVKVDFVKGDSLPGGQNTFFVELFFTAALTGEQQKRLLEIARACPVHKLLSKPNEVVTVIK